MRYHISVDGQRYEVEIAEGDQHTRLKVDDQELVVDLKLVNAPSLYSLLVADHSHELLVEEREGGYAVFIDTELYEVKVQTDRALRLAQVKERAGAASAGETLIKAPMPGLVVAVEVEPGAAIAKGKGLLILAAMKMENEIRAPRAGTVKRIAVAPGQTVNNGDVLMVLE